MEIKPNRYDKMLGLFVSNDELRPKMMQPCKRGDFVFATDAYAVVKMPCEILNLDYSQDHDFYDVEKFFCFDRNIEASIDFEPIEKWFETVPMLSIYEDCENCDGEGTVYCKHCKNESDCHDCNGTGHGKEIRKEPRHFDRYEMKGVGFSYKNLYRIFLLSKNENTAATWLFRDSTKINIFQIGKIEVGLMPLLG